MCDQAGGFSWHKVLQFKPEALDTHMMSRYIKGTQSLYNTRSFSFLIQISTVRKAIYEEQMEKSLSFWTQYDTATQEQKQAALNEGPLQTGGHCNRMAFTDSENCK
jgi:hypothetical protein